MKKNKRHLADVMLNRAAKAIKKTTHHVLDWMVLKIIFTNVLCLRTGLGLTNSSISTIKSTMSMCDQYQEKENLASRQKLIAAGSNLYVVIISKSARFKHSFSKKKKNMYSKKIRETALRTARQVIVFHFFFLSFFALLCPSTPPSVVIALDFHIVLLPFPIKTVNFTMYT